MRDLLRWSLVIALVLLLPVVPFLALGDTLDDRVRDLLDHSPSTPATAGLIVAALASDIFLPVPSSFVSTFAGSRLGFIVGTSVVWIGMTLGATIGFALARLFGRPLAARFASPDDLRRMEGLAKRGGPVILALTRPLPILAEATVLLFGATGLPWRHFLPVICLANLGLALLYAGLGHYANREGNVAVALLASVAIPLLASMLARRRLRSEAN